MHQGCREALNLKDELPLVIIDRDLRLKVYNEIRDTVLEMYIDIRKLNKGSAKEQEFYEKCVAEGNLNALDILDILEKDEGKFKEEIFIVKSSVIHDEWKKRKAKQ